MQPKNLYFLPYLLIFGTTPSLYFLKYVCFFLLWVFFLRLISIAERWTRHVGATDTDKCIRQPSYVEVITGKQNSRSFFFLFFQRAQCFQTQSCHFNGPRKQRKRISNEDQTTQCLLVEIG
ncbi:unnamed protein product [Amoebophrya sp. A120]|nr:unnamed protein product [Amoebophrya sp. A120]|eukprot:GSA120T00008168001.1